MKVNPITTLIAIALCALIAYGFYSFNDNAQKVLLAVGSFILLTIGLVFSLGIKFSAYSGSVNIKSASMLFFGVALTSNIIFSFIVFSQEAYIVLHGILLLLYLLAMYYLIRTLPK